jgi:hypothetical protein
MRKLGRVLGAVAVSLAALASEGRGQERAPSVDGLRELVRQLVSLETAASEEENRWREQEAHLQTTLELLEKEKQVLTERLASVREQEDTAGEERQRLAARVEAAEGLLGRIDAEVRQAAERLLAVWDGLPEPLRLTLKGGAERVRDSVAAEDRVARVADSLRLVNAFSSDLDRILGSVHAVKQVLEVDGEGRREMDVLYLGAAVGYWVGPENRRAGLLVRSEGGWKPVRRDGLARAVRRAIEVFAKEKPAELVGLPLPGETGR